MSIKNNNIRIKVVVGLLSLGIFVVCAGEVSAQRTDDEDKNNQIVLTKDARKNGYKLKKKGNKIYVQANNVYDPVKKKLLEGLRKALLRCKEEEKPRILQLIFALGNSKPVMLPCVAEDIEGEALVTLVVNRLK